MRQMLVLGIDTSCDDTSCAVVRDGREILSSVVSSQIDVHRKFGGVVPELACRCHIRNVLPVIDAALAGAGAGLEDIDAIAVTNRPGLIGALLIGLTAAKTLSAVTGIPLVALDHVACHLYSAHITHPGIAMPCVGLVVSGGHTHLYHCRDHFRHELLGGTQDDAAGEAYDKVACILDLGYPGGKPIDDLARQGDPRAVHFKRTFLDRDELEFSFSGIKTGVLYHVRGQNAGKPVRKSKRRNRNTKPRPDASKADVASSFQEAVVDILVGKTLQAVRQTGARSVIVTGGVAANSRLREVMRQRCERKGVEAFFPEPALCTDNAAMVAGLGWHYARRGRTAGLGVDAAARTDAVR